MRVPKPDPKRSALMARVRQRGTTPELVVASILRNLGLAYRLNVRGLAGSPDFSNRRRRWAIYVHGCFWHQHTGCKHATMPKANEAFWRDKFTTNRRRDANAIRSLAPLGVSGRDGLGMRNARGRTADGEASEGARGFVTG